MSQPLPTIVRKLDHLSINLESDVELSGLGSGFERLQLMNDALPNLCLDDVDVSTRFLERTLAAPLLVSSMTGGVERGWEITRRLAAAAEELGCAIGVGSQRAALEDPTRANFYRVRDVAPTAPLYANLGAVQLNYGMTIDDCRRAVDMIGADGLFLHLNPLQEALQPEGNTDFRNLATRIASVCRWLEVPVIVKEVGFGIAPAVAHTLADCGVAAIDVSGAGGTSWSAVEHLRCDDARYREIARSFLSWGIPTARCLSDVRSTLPEMPLIASGGVRTGLDAAKALALGASMVGIAGPLLRAANQSQECALNAMQTVIDELRIATFAAGASTIQDLNRSMLFETAEPVLTHDRPAACTP